MNSYLRTVTGETAPIEGKARLQLKIGSTTVSHDMWVANIQDECIVGLDLLEPLGCLVDLSESVLQIGEEEIALQKPDKRPVPKCYRVVLETSVTLPPRSESVVPARVEKPQAGDVPGRWGILESRAAGVAYSQGLLVGRSLVELGQPTIPVRVMNLTDQERRVRKGADIATCEIVQSVLKTNEVTSSVLEARDVELPGHLKELYGRSTTGLNPGEQEQVLNFLREFSDVFSKGPHDLGQTDAVKHQIDTRGAAPIRQPPRRLPLAKREEAQRAIRDMHVQGVIEPSARPRAAPIVLVKKKNGDTRFSVDYRKLNDVTHKDSYPLPRIDDTLEALAGAKLFSTLDLKSGYWQVQMDPESKEKTAFTSGCGLWQFRVMPFGLCNAPATFERLMEQVLAGLPLSVCLIYLDDILVPGCTFNRAIHNLREVFQRLRLAKLKLSPKKCTLFQMEVKYLGYVVSSEGVAMDEDKVRTVKHWPRPKDITELKGFLGLCSYYRRFIPSFADVAAPLHEFTRKTRPFEWTTESDDAFQHLK